MSVGGASIMAYQVINGLGSGAEERYIQFVEQNLGINFPQAYLECIRQADQGTFEEQDFEFINPANGKNEESFLGAFLSFNPKNPHNILRAYFMMPSFFPRTLVPFAEVGNGDLICFDYSVSGFEDPDPPVVYWIHDNPEEKEVADLAINFKEFLNKLQPLEEGS